MFDRADYAESTGTGDGHRDVTTARETTSDHYEVTEVEGSDEYDQDRSAGEVVSITEDEEGEEEEEDEREDEEEDEEEDEVIYIGDSDEEDQEEREESEETDNDEEESVSEKAAADYDQDAADYDEDASDYDENAADYLDGTLVYNGEALNVNDERSDLDEEGDDMDYEAGGLAQGGYQHDLPESDQGQEVDYDRRGQPAGARPDVEGFSYGQQQLRRSGFPRPERQPEDDQSAQDEASSELLFDLTAAAIFNAQRSLYPEIPTSSSIVTTPAASDHRISARLDEPPVVPPDEPNEEMMIDPELRDGPTITAPCVYPSLPTPSFVEDNTSVILDQPAARLLPPLSDMLDVDQIFDTAQAELESRRTIVEQSTGSDTLLAQEEAESELNIYYNCS